MLMLEVKGLTKRYERVQRPYLKDIFWNTEKQAIFCFLINLHFW